jgi:hypothetical protein
MICSWLWSDEGVVCAVQKSMFRGVGGSGTMNSEF